MHRIGFARVDFRPHEHDQGCAVIEIETDRVLPAAFEMSAADKPPEVERFLDALSELARLAVTHGLRPAGDEK